MCNAWTSSFDDAIDDFHRLVWNQDVVPFLIIHTPSGIKLYSGFRHSHSASGKVEGILQRLTDFNNISDLIEEFHADSHKDGKKIVYSGRMSPEKGLHVLLDAYRQVLPDHPDATLDLVGPWAEAPRDFIALPGRSDYLAPLWKTDRSYRASESCSAPTGTVNLE